MEINFDWSYKQTSKYTIFVDRSNEFEFEGSVCFTPHMCLLRYVLHLWDYDEHRTFILINAELKICNLNLWICFHQMCLEKFAPKISKKIFDVKFYWKMSRKMSIVANKGDVFNMRLHNNVWKTFRKLENHYLLMNFYVRQRLMLNFTFLRKYI